MISSYSEPYPDIIIDLCKHKDKTTSKYDIFWKVATQFLAGKAADAIIAVDVYKHSTIVNLATAILVNDLLHQIERECLPETPISNAQWLRCNFVLRIQYG